MRIANPAKSNSLVTIWQRMEISPTLRRYLLDRRIASIQGWESAQVRMREEKGGWKRDRLLSCFQSSITCGFLQICDILHTNESKSSISIRILGLKVLRGVGRKPHFFNKPRITFNFPSSPPLPISGNVVKAPFSSVNVCVADIRYCERKR